MEAGGGGRLSQILVALEELDDAALHAVIARAQGLLLDRPVSPQAAPTLTVEVVGREEGRLLAAYRALAPLEQHRLLGYVAHLVKAPRRLARRRRSMAPPAAGAGPVPPSLLTKPGGASL